MQNSIKRENYQETENERREYLRMFLIMILSVSILCIIIFFIFFIGQRYTTFIFTITMIIIFTIVIITFLLHIYTIIYSANSLHLPGQRILKFYIVKLLPFFLFPTGRLFFSKDAISRYIIKLNNSIVKKISVKKPRILVLLPHCLQYDKCPHKITFNIELCRACGKCQISEFLEMKDKVDSIFVATGGTLARRIVFETRPNIIIAVACERDLYEGIRDAYPFPVFGVWNYRPNGPCFNTKVDIKLFKKSIEFFIGEKG